MAKTIAGICGRCNKFYRGEICPCKLVSKKKAGYKGDVAFVNKDNWARGWHEHIDKEPIFIRDKAHLIQECKKRGVYPKAFTKHKSQGKGLDYA